jgi:hypothetical protein
MARGAAPGREAWRVPPAALASYILTGSTAMLIGSVSLFTIVGFVVAVMFAGAAVGTIELNDKVSLRAPFAYILRYTKTVAIPLALTFVFFCAIVVAYVNLIAAFELGRGWRARSADSTRRDGACSSAPRTAAST